MTDIKQVVVRSGLELPDWRTTIERRGGRLAVIESAALKEAFYTTDRPPPEHDHSTDAGELPVIVFDLHLTLTPSNGFTDPAYPGALLPPYPGVKTAMDALVAGGCCLHLATAALSPYRPPEIIAARRKLIAAYLTHYGLPVSYVTGKVSARIFYDDRGVPALNRPWPDIHAEVLEHLAARFDLGPDGIWRRKDIPDAGHAYEMPDPASIGPDQPRGLSTRIIDVDLHRCLFTASSSKLESGLAPGALDAVTQIYGAGYTVHLSCAGWDPMTHPTEESAMRLAAMRQQVRAAGVPYDQMVSKDHPDVAVDDRFIRRTDWKTDLPVLLATLATSHPEDEVTLATQREDAQDAQDAQSARDLA
jgi:hypothetical protein